MKTLLTIDEYQDRYTAEIRIRAIRDQIREYEWRKSISNSFESSWWFEEAIKSLNVRIKYYAQFVK